MKKKRKDLWTVVLGLSPVSRGGAWGNPNDSAVVGKGNTPEAAIMDFESAMRGYEKEPPEMRDYIRDLINLRRGPPQGIDCNNCGYAHDSFCEKYQANLRRSAIPMDNGYLRCDECI